MQKYESYKDSGINWIGQIPSNWEVCSIRNYAQEYTEKNKPEKTRELLALSYALGVTLYRDKQFNMDRVKENYEEYKIVYENTLVVSPNDIIKGSAYVSKYYGCISPMYLTLKSRFNDPSYLYYLGYLLRTKQAGRTFFSIAKGLIGSILDNGKYVTRRMSVSRPDFMAFKVLMPPVNEQKAIIRYLDDKCVKIDEWLVKKQEEVELLMEIKQRVIADAVTRGLDTNVKMKPANITGVPEVPEHWEVLRNKTFLKLTDEKVGDRKDITLLSLTKQGVIIRDITDGKGKFPKEFDTYLVVRPNNLIFCLFDIDETPRTVGLVRNYGMITGAYTNFEVDESIILPEYVYLYYLQIDEIKGLRPYYTGLRKTVKTGTFLQLRMPIPPLSEQRAIVTYINERTVKIDKMLENVNKEIEALKEYKQRLISDVVTGQIKVC